MKYRHAIRATYEGLRALLEVELALQEPLTPRRILQAASIFSSKKPASADYYAGQSLHERKAGARNMLGEW